jgi:hypothetical protein
MNSQLCQYNKCFHDQQLVTNYSRRSNNAVKTLEMGAEAKRI